MKSKFTFFLLLAAVFIFAFRPAPVGEQFPPLHGETLNGKSVDVPGETNGKFTLLGMAYSKKAEEDLMTWTEPMFNHFLFEGTNMFGESAPDVNLYIIPMFTGAKAAVEGKAKKIMMEQIDPKFHDHVLVYHGSNHDYKAKLHTDHKENPYFFLLDPSGKIIYKTEGAYSSDKLAKIDALMGDDDF